jgi:hypothetical protein
MKRYLRLCLIFLISLTLPLTGMAGVQAPTEPCPMKTTGMVMMADMGMDCCNDMKSSADHSKPCKSGQECKNGSIVEVLAFRPPASPLTAVMGFVVSDSAPVGTSSGVWRPPRA